MSQTTNKTRSKKRSRLILLLGLVLLSILNLATETFAQQPQPTQRTPIGVINGNPVYADEVINQINNNSPFMPALEDDKLDEPTTSPSPNSSPVPTHSTSRLTI